MRENREGFQPRYHEAREIGCYTMADQVHDIAEDGRNDRWLRENKDGSVEFVTDPANVRRSQLRCDARKWLLSKMLPKRFGHRPDTNLKPEGHSDLAELMKQIDGRTRGLPNRRPELNQTNTG